MPRVTSESRPRLRHRSRSLLVAAGLVAIAVPAGLPTTAAAVPGPPITREVPFTTNVCVGDDQRRSVKGTATITVPSSIAPGDTLRYDLSTTYQFDESFSSALDPPSGWSLFGDLPAVGIAGTNRLEAWQAVSSSTSVKTVPLTPVTVASTSSIDAGTVGASAIAVTLSLGRFGIGMRRTDEVDGVPTESVLRYSCYSQSGPVTLATISVESGLPPEIKSLDDVTGPHTGGKPINIHGRFPRVPTAVTFGDAPATFERIDSTTIRATLPAHAPADNVRVKVVDAVGTTPDTVADDFDYYDAAEPDVVEQTATLDCNQYVARVRVRVKVSKPVQAGQPLSLAVGATFLFDQTLMRQLTAGISMGVLAPQIGIAGTDTSAVRQSTFGYPRRSDVAYPTGFDFPRSPPLAAGVVNADASSIVLTLLPSLIELRGSGVDPVDGMPWDWNEKLTCTPRSDVLATIPVGAEEPVPVVRNFGVAGTATLKTLTQGSFPLKGTLDTTITTASGAITGDLKLDNTEAKLVALGFLPVTAKLAFASTEPTIGTLTSGVWSTTSKVRVKIPSVKLFGLELVSTDTRFCQAKQITSIALKSTAPAFDPAAGGNLAGSFAISNLTGCGALTGIVSSLTAGKNNLISLNLTPKS